jgi:hypothetical protein
MPAHVWLAQLGRVLGVLLAVFLLPVSMVGCSDGGGPTDPGPEPAISVALGSSSVEVVQGQSNTVPVTITRAGGFGGAVALALVGAPTGLTGSFDPSSVPAGATTSTLTVAASGELAPGILNVTVRASGDGINDATAALELTVDPAPAYTLTLAPSSVTVVPGDAEDAAIQLDRTNFTGEVALSVSGAPEGVTTSLDPASTTGDTSILTVQVGAGTEEGDYTLTVTAQADGLDDRATELELTVTPAGGDWVQVSAGQYHTCAVDEGGDAYCWGRNEYGQLGDGTTTMRVLPRLVTGGHTWTSVTAGIFHTCGITTAGDGFCWGNGNFGLGDGSTASSSTPQPIAVSGGDTWALLSAGWYFTCGLTPDGRAYCWGRNSHGVLGDSTGSTQLTPALVAGDHSWHTINAGESHACGITDAGEAYCWGNRQHGRVGDGGLTGTAWVPTLVSGGHAWRDVSAESWHTCAITTAGAGYCWGFNSFGQLGIGNTETQSTPSLILNDHTWTDMNPVTAHTTCGITDAAEAYCWGANAAGQVGIGTESRNEVIPRLVSGGFRWKSVSGGLSHTCGITHAGVAYCWGMGRYGQLGNGSAEGTIYPTPIRVLDPQ